MKKLGWIIIIVGLAYAVYRMLPGLVDSPTQFFDNVLSPAPVGTSPAGTRRGAGGGHSVDEEGQPVARYATALRTLTGQVLGPLQEQPGSRMDVASVLRDATHKWQSGEIDEAEFRAVEQIANLLSQAVAERSRAEKSYRDLATKSMTTLSQAPGEKKEFFMREQQRQWTVYVDGVRPRISRELQNLDRLEAR